MAVDLRQLRYFVAVCDAQQVTGAARQLHVAQPALTQALRSLERDVGVTLLDRHPRGVTPTKAGAQFYLDARAALDAVDAAVERARGGAREARRLRIGSLSGDDGVLDRALLQYRRDYPEFSVSWQALPFSRELASVVDDDVDASFLWSDYREPAGVRIERVAPFPLHLYVEINSPLARLDVVRFEHFEDGIWPGQHPSVPDEFADLYYMTAQRGHRPRRSNLQPLDATATWALIAEGRVLTVGPGPVRPTVAANLIAQRPVVDAEPFWGRIAYRTDNANPALGAFLAVLRAVAK
jgi:DNA-binding transcriptional LysR family regulator